MLSLVPYLDQVYLVHLVQLVLQVHKVLKVDVVNQVHLVTMVQLVCQVQRVLKVNVVNEVHKVRDYFVGDDSLLFFYSRYVRSR